MKPHNLRRLAAAGATLAVVFASLAAVSAAEKAKPYTMQVNATPAKPDAGGKTTLALTITPRGEWKLKNETPFKATLKPTAGLSVSKTTLTAKDFERPDTPAKTVKAEVSARQAGAQSVAVDLTFFLCTDQICQRYQDTTALTIEVGKGD